MSMLDVMDDDIKNMLNAEFSESIIITSGSSSVTISGFYDKGFLQVDPDTSLPVLSVKPRVLVYVSDVTVNLVQGETTITARGKTWTYTKKRLNGDGSMALYLE
jgi:hypothetical protein